ncbi:quinone oxidoreductase family protein [Mesobacterium pallidum]|uniref:quinone oxidoreductase family protein n=1 Tax=Mesobacterium pallidum TaxID=2872037 RepID=UPI001EE1E511|nr:NAD(P)-dependent alcohol dehydrogenase [Mesobacterium pallidum]
MRAIVSDRYGDPDTLTLADLPRPEPGAGELRLRVLACGVNLSDWEYLVGRPFYARLAGGLFRPRRRVLGSDIVGVVDAVGSGVDGFAPGVRVMGDLVMTRGGFAEYACVPASEMVPVPAELGDDIAACLPQPGGIAVTGTDGLRPGQRLLINGAGGGSGTMALQLAKAAGAHVTCVDNAGKIAWLQGLGADAVMDYTQQDFTATGERWDVILDMVATRGPGRIARALAPGGRYRAVGGRMRTLLALLLGGLIYRGTGMSIGMLIVPSGAALTERVGALAASGRVAPHLEQVMPLEAVPEALARTGAGAVRGKIVIRPGQGGLTALRRP